jgi:hypothetical protein
MDLALEGCTRILGLQANAGAELYTLLEYVRCNLRHLVSLLQREGRLGSATWRRLQAPWDGCGGLDFEQDWTDYRPISRSSVKLRDARDYVMNES